MSQIHHKCALGHINVQLNKSTKVIEAHGLVSNVYSGSWFQVLGLMTL